MRAMAGEVGRIVDWVFVVVGGVEGELEVSYSGP